MRVVFDTNVLISAALFENSVPNQAFQTALNNGTILLSLDTLNELNRVLSRPKFDRYVSTDEREEFLIALVERSMLVDISAETVEKTKLCRDPKDDKFLAVAVDGSADYLVSGDDDLLVLNPFRSIPIITPVAFVAFTHSS